MGEKRIQFSQRGAEKMPEFEPKKIEKEVISLRVPSDMLAEVDKQSAAREMSRNEFINQCIRFALDNMICLSAL